MPVSSEEFFSGSEIAVLLGFAAVDQMGSCRHWYSLVAHRDRSLIRGPLDQQALSQLIRRYLRRSRRVLNSENQCVTRLRRNERGDGTDQCWQPQAE